MKYQKEHDKERLQRTRFQIIAMEKADFLYFDGEKLRKDEVAELMLRLQMWLQTGSLKIPRDGDSK